MSFRKSHLLFAVCIIMLGLVYMYVLQTRTIRTTETESINLGVFTNTENVSVRIDSLPDRKEVLFSGIGYIDLPIVATTSASGVRYLNNETAIEVRNKGSEVTVYRAGDQVFHGISGSMAITESSPTDHQPIVFIDALTDYTWQWIQPELDQAVTESFTLKHNKDGTLYATTDCNNYSGTYSITNNNKINYSLTAATLQSCADMSLEKKYIDLLEQIETVDIHETMELQLINNDGTVRMPFITQLIPML